MESKNAAAIATVSIGVSPTADTVKPGITQDVASSDSASTNQRMAKRTRYMNPVRIV